MVVVDRAWVYVRRTGVIGGVTYLIEKNSAVNDEEIV